MKRILKILFKTIVGIAVIAVLTGLMIFVFYHKELPQGTAGPGAEAMAQRMLEALDYEQYKATRFLEWSYVRGRHRYKWDKELGQVAVEWASNKALLNLNKTAKSSAWVNGSEVHDQNKIKLVQKALAYFNNDSFWLVAPFKVYDKGTERSLVTFDDGTKGLMVTYAKGGTTPGDSYVWKLAPNGLPESYLMWVNILPIGGLEASWEEWKPMENGLLLPSTHKIGPITLDMGTVKAYN